MSKIIRIGIDTSKSVFQLHGVDAAENPILRKKLRRQQFLAFVAKLDPTRIGLEACGAAHHWARELSALGHEIVLLPPQYVKPYVKRGKHDAADAEAICEAMSRPSMRFVPVKTVEQQAALMLAGTREQLVRRQHAADQHDPRLRGRVRAHRSQGDRQDRAAAGAGCERCGFARACEGAVRRIPADEYAGLKRQIQEIEAKLMAWHKDSETEPAAREIPVARSGASLLAMKVADPHAFRSGRDFSAWIGLTSKNHSTAGKTRLGVITRAGDEALRRMLVRRRNRGDPAGPAGKRTRLALAGQPSQAQAAQARRRGARQQDGAHRLETDGQR